MEPLTLIETVSNKESPRGSLFKIRNDNNYTSKYLILCGIQNMNSISFDEKASLEFYTKIKHGNIKLILHNISNNEITQYIFTNGKNIINMDSGTYNMYYVGKSFSGEVSFTTTSLIKYNILP